VSALPWHTHTSSIGTYCLFNRTSLVDFLQNSVQSTQRPLLCRKFFHETLSTIMFVFVQKFNRNFIFFSKNHVYNNQTMMSRWEGLYTVKAVHMVDNSGSTSCCIISRLSQEIFVRINRILAKFCPWNLGVPLIMTHCVYLCFSSFPRHYHSFCIWLPLTLNSSSDYNG